MKPPIKLSIAALGALALAGVTLVTQPIFAASTSSTTTNPASDLVARIAAKFNLNQDEVQAVADEVHQEREDERTAERQAETSTRLDAAVIAGTITAAQKEAITAKLAEVGTKMEALRSTGDRSTHKEAMQALRTELETWATEQGINASLLRPTMKGGDRGGHGPRGEGFTPPSSPSAETTTQL